MIVYGLIIFRFVVCVNNFIKKVLKLPDHFIGIIILNGGGQLFSFSLLIRYIDLSMLRKCFNNLWGCEGSMDPITKQWFNVMQIIPTP